MTPALFILTITLYLISLVVALMAALFSKFISSRFINTLIIFHVLTILVWLIIPLTGSLLFLEVAGFLFLSFFCSGIVIGGMVLRKKYILPLKIYFAIFISSVIIFIGSPSRVIGFISTGTLNAINPDRIHLIENYFLVEQNENTTQNKNDSTAYKLIREMGFFHKTLTRNIIIPSQIDSISISNFNLEENIVVRIYSGENDMELNVSTQSTNSKIITRKTDL